MMLLECIGIVREMFFFNVNDDERVKCFSGITGTMKVVMGFSSSISGNQFELVECGQNFI